MGYSRCSTPPPPPCRRQPAQPTVSPTSRQKAAVSPMPPSPNQTVPPPSHPPSDESRIVPFVSNPSAEPVTYKSPVGPVFPPDEVMPAPQDEHDSISGSISMGSSFTATSDEPSFSGTNDRATVDRVVENVEETVREVSVEKEGLLSLFEQADIAHALTVQTLHSNDNVHDNGTDASTSMSLDAKNLKRKAMEKTAIIPGLRKANSGDNKKKLKTPQPNATTSNVAERKMVPYDPRRLFFANNK